MNIQSILVERENLELTRPYSISYKTVTSVENIIVKVVGENGMVGIGATNPSKMVVGEDLNDTEALLTDEVLGKFVGRDIREIHLLCQEIHQLFPDKLGAKAAMDIAFHDLFAQTLGVPLAGYLGQYHHQLPTSITIGIKNLAETMEEAEEYVGRGFSYLKIKIGGELEEDMERLVKLREKYGDKIHIRVDANQGYSIAEFTDFYHRSQKLDLELVEQPLPRNKTADMGEFPQEIRKVIAADESLVNVTDALTLTQGETLCGIFNIKLMKCGGVYQAKRIAEQASHYGVDLMWGCNDESIISITAALHAAFSCPHTRYLDLDGSLDLAKDVVSGGFRIKDGIMSLAGGTGLGVNIL